MTNWRIALWVVLVGITLWFLFAVRGVLLPFGLAWIIAIFLEPVIDRLEAKGLKRPIAVFSIATLFFAVVGGLVVLAVPHVSNQLNDVRISVQTLTDSLAKESSNSNHFLSWNPVVRAEPPGPLGFIDRALDQGRPLLQKFDLPTTRRSIFDQYVDPHRKEMTKAIQGFFNGFLSLVGGAASQVLGLAFTPLFVVMILVDMKNFRARMANWIPPSIRAGTISTLHDVGDVFKKYLRGVVINVSCYIFVMSLLLSALGTPYSILLAMLAGTLYLIPILGGWIGMITLFVTAGLSGSSGPAFFHLPSSWAYATLLALVFTIVNTSWDTFITPNVVGKAVNLHPLVSMFVVFSGGALAGLPGMMVAYPIAGSAKVILERLMNVSTKTGDLRLPQTPLRHRNSIEP